MNIVNTVVSTLGSCFKPKTKRRRRVKRRVGAVRRYRTKRAVRRRTRRR